MSLEQNAPDPALRSIENALGSLVPTRTQIDRDRLMFQAGQASSRASTSGRHTWMAIAASLAVVVAGEAALLAHQPAPRVVEKLVVVREPANAPADTSAQSTATSPSPASAPAAIEPGRHRSLDAELAYSPAAFSPALVSFARSQAAYERLAGQLLRDGLDGLPASPTAALRGSQSGPAPSRLQLQEELRTLLDPGDHS